MQTKINAYSKVVPLRAGQALWEYLPKGSSVTVEEGNMEIKANYYIDQTQFSISISIGSGQSHLVEVAGWYEIHSTRRSSVIRLIEKEKSLIFLFGKIRRLMQRIKSHLGSVSWAASLKYGNDKSH